jgi:actin-related protein
MEDGTREPHGSKIIVIHPGSLNLRIGLANDAVPKTVPMCIARKDTQTELEANSSEALPRRVGVDGVLPPDPERWFGEEVCASCLGYTANKPVCWYHEENGGRSAQEHAAQQAQTYAEFP